VLAEKDQWQTKDQHVMSRKCLGTGQDLAEGSSVSRDAPRARLHASSWNMGAAKRKSRASSTEDATSASFRAGSHQHLILLTSVQRTACVRNTRHACLRDQVCAPFLATLDVSYHLRDPDSRSHRRTILCGGDGRHHRTAQLTGACQSRCTSSRSST
jgi:hypothetical protein